MGALIPNPRFEAELHADPVFRARMDAVGEIGLEELRSRIPVLSGELLASAELIHLPDGGQRLQVGTDHWIFPEFGTSDMAAEPYLRPTLDELKARL